jgi:hypothetical protein
MTNENLALRSPPHDIMSTPNLIKILHVFEKAWSEVEEAL